MGRKKSAPPLPSVWTAPEPRRRAAPVALTRAKIVQAAIAIADKEGLEAVSLRRVAARLRAMPMRLYTYTETKVGLLDLMVDDVCAAILASIEARDDWRRAVREIARRTRDASLQHPWFADLLGGRPPQGPNGLAYVEAFLAAFEGAPALDDIDRRMQAFRTVHAYLLGALRNELAEARAEQESGLTKKQWQRASAAHLERTIAAGGFPLLERVMRESSDVSPEALFAAGLDCVLEGVAALSA